MLVGYNHNIKHEGQMFHIQTEDSGRPSMSVTTLLFIDGTIIASKKSKYAELAEKEGYEKELRLLMQNQHKELLLQLRDGFYDDKIKPVAVEAPEEGKEPEGFADALSILDVLSSLEDALLDSVMSKPKSAGGASPLHGEKKGFDEVLLGYLKSKDEENLEK